LEKKKRGTNKRNDNIPKVSAKEDIPLLPVTKCFDRSRKKRKVKEAGQLTTGTAGTRQENGEKQQRRHQRWWTF